MLILTTPELHNQTIFNTEPVQLQGLEILQVPFSYSLNAPSGTEQTFLLGLITSTIDMSPLSLVRMWIPSVLTPIIDATNTHRRTLVYNIPVQHVLFDDPNMQHLVGWTLLMVVFAIVLSVLLYTNCIQPSLVWFQKVGQKVLLMHLHWAWAHVDIDCTYLHILK